MNEEDINWRPCGICGEKTIPRGVEWFVWKGGSCICPNCAVRFPVEMTLQEARDQFFAGSGSIVATEGNAIRIQISGKSKEIRGIREGIFQVGHNPAENVVLVRVGVVVDGESHTQVHYMTRATAEKLGRDLLENALQIKAG